MIIVFSFYITVNIFIVHSSNHSLHLQKMMREGKDHQERRNILKQAEDILKLTQRQVIL